jgi:hypothetical protein
LIFDFFNNEIFEIKISNFFFNFETFRFGNFFSKLQNFGIFEFRNFFTNLLNFDIFISKFKNYEKEFRNLKTAKKFRTKLRNLRNTQLYRKRYFVKVSSAILRDGIQHTKKGIHHTKKEQNTQKNFCFFFKSLENRELTTQKNELSTQKKNKTHKKRI